MTDELRFDALLREDAAALPPPAAGDVTPWRTAMGQVLWGMGLTTITLNFLYLDYLLPALGTVLLVLGFRTLRRENAALRWGYILSLAALATRYMGYVLSALPLEAGYVPAYITAAVQLALYVCLWRGMVGVSRAAGAEKPAVPAAGAMAVFYAVLLVLAFIGLEGWLLVLPLLVLYMLLLRSMVRLSRALADTGYAITAAPVRLPGWAVLWGSLAALLAAVLLAMCLGQRCAMDWQVRDDAPQAAAARQELLDKGFPQEVLEDLTAAELLQLDGAERVWTKTDHRDGVVITHATVLLAEEPRRAVFIQHIAAGRQLHGFVESAETWPVWQADSQQWYSGDYLSGRVLCCRQGQTFTAELPMLQRTALTARSMLFGTSVKDAIVARWSWPRNGENGRAYLIYDAFPADDWVYMYSWCSYVRQTRPVYPYSDPLTLWNSYHSGAVDVLQSNQHEGRED